MNFFWQALGEALIQIRRARSSLGTGDLRAADQALLVAGQRILLAGRSMTPSLRSTRAQVGLAPGLVAVREAQRQMAAGNVPAAVAAVRRALGAIGASMRLALRARTNRGEAELEGLLEQVDREVEAMARRRRRTRPRRAIPPPRPQVDPLAPTERPPPVDPLAPTIPAPGGPGDPSAPVIPKPPKVPRW